MTLLPGQEPETLGEIFASRSSRCADMVRI